MAVLLGIDVGTQSAKVLLLDAQTQKSAVASASYGLSYPAPGFVEQDPEDWWQAVVKALLALKEKHPELYAGIAAISFSGQMHGFVAVDSLGRPVRPAIIWMDRRSEQQIARAEQTLGPDRLAREIQNRLFPGFALPSLLWMQEHEPHNLARTHRILMPKDYVRFRMTGELGTDACDASSTAAFDLNRRDWAWSMIDDLGLPREIFPRCGEGTDPAGAITQDCARETGLRPGIPVVCGTGDQPAHCIGAGAVREGVFVSNIGTGGQLAAYSRGAQVDPQLRLNRFCHGIDRAYTVFGAHMSSGICLSWLKDQVLRLPSFDDVTALAQKAPPGAEGVLFLPFLSGSRNPLAGAGATGTFFGLKTTHTDAHLARAVMEAVVLDFLDDLLVFEELGLGCESVVACGGGARSPLWLQIQADILNRPVQVCQVQEQAAMGACILAGVGAGLLPDVRTACRQLVRLSGWVYLPNPENTEIYRERYRLYRRLYRQIADLYQ